MYSRRTVEEVEAIATAGAVAQAAVTVVGIEPSTRGAATRSERRGKRAGGNDSELSCRFVAVLVFFSAALAYLVVAKFNNRDIASRVLAIPSVSPNHEPSKRHNRPENESSLENDILIAPENLVLENRSVAKLAANG
ncbi:hypothetical protein ALC57_18875 [Trachymyrmex cornetzi]|uniref:Uncharacterized protein n=1 Tax=Trachymyrmex cornetzi TaxID=471704 RepID=A0A195D916_9HYME|nr:hypothetical protein ALC57_18875 [Trachymyrmex cornetzi]